MLGSRRSRVVVVMLAAAFGGAGAAPAPSTSPVGITRAQTAALTKAPGELVNTRLALDHGRLVYGVEVQTSPATLTSVEVDARSGKVLHVRSRLERSPFPREVEAP